MKKRIFSILVIFSLIYPMSAFSQTATKTKAELENDLKALEQEIQSHKTVIKEKQKEAVSLNRDVTILGSKINESKAKIKQQSIKINNLSSDIKEKEENISQLAQKINKQKDSLSQILRKKNDLDQTSFVEFALNHDTLSGFFGDEDSFDVLQESIKESFQKIETIKKENESLKESLVDKKDEALTLKEIQEIEKQKTLEAQKKKEKILVATKGEEKKYQTILKDREKEAGKIRAALFELRDTNAISFGTALTYANSAGKSAGVDPALILAILMQESSLGSNVGSCYLSDKNTGMGVSVKSGLAKPDTMNPTRDVPPFLSLMDSLGRDPYKTRVSCSQGFGWGGAMGASQFIASTWKIFMNRIQNATGASVADPWNPSHAIMATAFYLADLGAKSGNYADEKNAACKYYSGKSCSRSSAASTYGSSVMNKKEGVQAKIDVLQGN